MSSHLENKDLHHVIAGLKAAISNPHVSEEAKHNAQVHLHELEKDPHRVAAGYRASLHNPNVSLEAKKHAAQQLYSMGQLHPDDQKKLEEVEDLLRKKTK